MKNKQVDLNNHLFSQLERLGDEGLTGEKLQEEIDRSKAVTDVSKQLIASAALSIKAQRLIADGFSREKPEFFIEHNSDAGK